MRHCASPASGGFAADHGETLNLDLRHPVLRRGRGRVVKLRAGASQHVTLSEDVMRGGSGDVDLGVLDRALDRLESFDERKARFIEMRYLAGLSNGEIAEAMAFPNAP